MKTGKTATKFISILLATVMFSSLLTACMLDTHGSNLIPPRTNQFIEYIRISDLISLAEIQEILVDEIRSSIIDSIEGSTTTGVRSSFVTMRSDLSITLHQKAVAIRKEHSYDDEGRWENFLESNKERLAAREESYGYKFYVLGDVEYDAYLWQAPSTRQWDLDMFYEEYWFHIYFHEPVDTSIDGVQLVKDFGQDMVERLKLYLEIVAQSAESPSDVAETSESTS